MRNQLTFDIILRPSNRIGERLDLDLRVAPKSPRGKDQYTELAEAAREHTGMASGIKAMQGSKNIPKPAMTVGIILGGTHWPFQAVLRPAIASRAFDFCGKKYQNSDTLGGYPFR